MKHSDEDIARVARAIAVVDNEHDWTYYMPEAIAALDAMFKPREPREVWAVWLKGEIIAVSADKSIAEIHALNGGDVVLMREVIE